MKLSSIYDEIVENSKEGIPVEGELIQPHEITDLIKKTGLDCVLTIKSEKSFGLIFFKNGTPQFSVYEEKENIVISSDAIYNIFEEIKKSDIEKKIWIVENFHTLEPYISRIKSLKLEGILHIPAGRPYQVGLKLPETKITEILDTLWHWSFTGYIQISSKTHYGTEVGKIILHKGDIALASFESPVLFTPLKGEYALPLIFSRAEEKKGIMDIFSLSPTQVRDLLIKNKDFMIEVVEWKPEEEIPINLDEEFDVSDEFLEDMKAWREKMFERGYLIPKDIEKAMQELKAHLHSVGYAYNGSGEEAIDRLIKSDILPQIRKEEMDKIMKNVGFDTIKISSDWLSSLSHFIVKKEKDRNIFFAVIDKLIGTDTSVVAPIESRTGEEINTFERIGYLKKLIEGDLSVYELTRSGKNALRKVSSLPK
ncbi:MAG: hypothetical protein ACE5K4_05375 [Candidatus Hydrothermarchaeota archaeon]